MNKFTKRPFAETIYKLMMADNRIPKRDGKVVVLAAAQKMKTNQPTVKRWADGRSKDPIEKNAALLCKWFGVTRDQLLGNAPIPWIDGDAVLEDDSILPAVAKIMAEIPNQPKALQQLFVNLYATAMQTYESMRETSIESDLHGSFATPQGKPSTRKERK